MDQMKLSAYDLEQKPEIVELFSRVFAESEGEQEGRVIGKFVRDLMETTDKQDIFGFVADENGQLTGSIFFTRLWFDAPIDAFILSPVAIASEKQGQGIGQTLINFGIDQLRAEGVTLLFTYGDPNYYAKVGFQQVSEDIFRAPQPLSQPIGWLCQTLDGRNIEPLSGLSGLSGKSRCVAALDNPELW